MSVEAVVAHSDGCNRRNFIYCTCDLDRHVDGCKFLRAASGVAIACDHGRDVCPKCDPCTCTNRERNMDRRIKVSEFHKAMDVPMLSRPTIPSDARVRLRLRLIAEEFIETLEACFRKGDWEGRDNLSNLLAYIDTTPIRVDLPEFADGLADLAYVVEGANLEFGIDGNDVFEEVHAANMRKVGGPIREDGKRGKPDGWVPPDIEGCLKRQGWEG